MPGYQQLRFMPHPTEYYHNEPIYGPLYKQQKMKKEKSKKQQQLQHPLYEDLKIKHQRERREYERMLASRDAGRGDFNPYKFDSLKLIGSCNDVSYLDNFMSMPRQRPQQEMGLKGRSKGLAKSSTTVFGKGTKEHRNSIQSDPSVSATLRANHLRSVASNDNIYESVEMIHYKKSVQNLNRIQKTRSLQKTGHPLFDHLREEQAMKGPAVRKTSNPRREEYSDGQSPSHSSSSSGDEYETYPRSRHGRQVPKNHHSELPKKEKHKAKRTESSESDEDWRMIPRPKFFGGPVRRIDGPLSTDESDSSINSAVLR